MWNRLHDGDCCVACRRYWHWVPDRHGRMDLRQDHLSSGRRARVDFRPYLARRIPLRPFSRRKMQMGLGNVESSAGKTATTLPSPSPRGLSSGGTGPAWGAYPTNIERVIGKSFTAGPGRELSKRVNARPAEGLVTRDW